ncbi:MAG TPA: acyl carrier protein [Verrucomicrobiae bacterium]|nr:acyl carrier protein [Verrucomicrobiae bacterium]
MTSYVRDELARSEPAGLGPTDSLISSGVLDSIGLLRLVLFLEERFQVKVGDGDLVPDNFETIERIVSFVESRSAAA